jgi:hypothetical protein
MHDPIAIELDEDERWVVFRRTAREQRGEFARDLMQLPPGFTLPDVLEASLATGLVIAKNSGLLLDSKTGCNDLAKSIDAILGCFKAPGKPTPRLARVVKQIRAGFDVEDSLPLWSYAWLDLVVREDIADAARESVDPWGSDRLELELASLRDRRVAEALQIHRGRTSAAGEHRLSKSKRSRAGDRKRKGKTG